MTLNLFFDNGLFSLLTKNDHENFYNNFHDSLACHIPSFKDKDCSIIFTEDSFLEYIGLGNILNLKPKLNLDKLNIDLKNIDEKKLSKILDEKFNEAINHFLKHPKLIKKILLEKIDEQLEHSKNLATTFIVKDTLIRYKTNIIEDYKNFHKSLAFNLAWHVICQLPFINLEQISKEKFENTKIILAKIQTALLRIFYHLYTKQKIELNSYRLSDKMSKNSTYLGHINNDNSIKKNYYFPYFLEDNKDLCDADYIHFATLGTLNFNNEQEPCLVFTTDEQKVIENRLIYQLHAIKPLCSLPNSTIKIIPGIVFIVDRENGKIKNKIDVSTIKKDAHIEFSYEENISNKNEILFRKPKQSAQ